MERIDVWIGVVITAFVVVACVGLVSILLSAFGVIELHDPFECRHRIEAREIQKGP